jgi:hypothetical protein
MDEEGWLVANGKKMVEPPTPTPLFNFHMDELMDTQGKRNLFRGTLTMMSYIASIVASSLDTHK